MIEEAS